MKFALIVFITMNSLIILNGDEVQNNKFIKHLNRIYSDLISGNLSANSDLSKFLSAKSENLNRVRCNNQLTAMIRNDSNTTEQWVIEMIDASGKIPAGILFGNTYSLGNFDQCLRILHNSRDVDNIGTIKGQYCIAPISINLDLAILIGLCIPDSCKPSYFVELLQNVFRQTNVSLLPIDPEKLCHIDTPIELSSVDIVAIIIFSITIGLMIASTAYDVYTTKTRDKTKPDLFIIFSVVTNGTKLFSTRSSQSPDVMLCLNGIRVLSLAWVIFGHAYVTLLASPVMNRLYLADWISNIFSMLVASATVSVDTFFLISGLLVTYSVFKELKKTNGKLNIPMVYLHRYLRLTPALMMTALVSVTFVPHTGQGPFSKMALPQLIACEKWWWSTLLYVQNYVNPEEICVPQSWYLQIDMQLFILSPIILIPLWKWGRNMLPVIFTIIFLSLGCYFATFYVNNFTVGILNGGDGNLLQQQMVKTYYPTHIRMGTWMLGTILAYTIIKTNNQVVKIPIWAVCGAWFITFCIIIAVIFGPYHMNQPGYKETTLVSATYSSLHRIAWCTALSWIIFACVKGYGGFINSILSHPVWLPLTRLSYSMYLLSLILQMYRAKIAKTQVYFSDYSAFNTFWGDFGITMTVSIFWVLAFESPIIALEKVIFRRKL